MKLTYDLKLFNKNEYLLFFSDCMKYPWAWVKVGIDFYARYIPEKALIETERRVSHE